MDARIGVLMREGRHVYYACIDGEFSERDTQEAVAALLDGIELVPAQKEKPAQKKRDYIVTVSMKYPAYDDEPFDMAITAANAKEAISEARRQNSREFRFSREDGPILYRARKGCE